MGQRRRRPRDPCNLLAMRDPVPSLQKLTMLLLVLDVSYARLARLAAAADHALGRDDFHANPDWLTQVARRLRSEYQSLITPTFSFDHHALKVRDAVLNSWEVSKLMDRADNLISMLRTHTHHQRGRRRPSRLGRAPWHRHRVASPAGDRHVLALRDQPTAVGPADLAGRGPR